MIQYDPYTVAAEIREQISSAKRRLGFLTGAGSSMAVGLPGIIDLTNQVEEKFDGLLKSQFQSIKASMGGTPNVEYILNCVRLYCEVIGDSEEREIDGIKGRTAIKNLDTSICRAIHDIVKSGSMVETKPHQTLAQWLHALHSIREKPVEVFTLNYDLLFEKAMEEVGVPYFDGFIGSVEPFFMPEAVEAEGEKEDENVYPPRSWTRLWKLHGSIGWRTRCGNGDGRKRITRVSGGELPIGEELMIFPSRDKYADSRKLPFLTLQDRLRRFLMNGEVLMVIHGYSFSDEHINEILFQGLRSNPRLSILSFYYGNLPDNLTKFGRSYRNLTLLAADKACIGGLVGEWVISRSPQAGEIWSFWDEEAKRFTLGNFNCFAEYLETFIGFKGLQRYSDSSFQPTLKGGEPSEG
ncbi:SIR2-like domain-containing protein [Pelosinus fermentans]|uniref:SIR2 family protein n=1 Tax=Pelosinus fermentans TaxID=365349 RepID=UPI0002686319|nr:SIR2 family protein [Pelosinus fermentans]OAM92457.1 hypothetical protein FR7_00473 [Pelosinus fermentans DSM 17108]SDQ45525.1 SIR2-like domain-containing protein [Pelosinus fermentans]